MTEVKIIVANDELINGNDARKNFVAQQKAGHCSVLIEETHYVVIKEVENAKLEKVRSIAGDIARDLAAQKVDKATVLEGVLGNVFAGLQIEDVHTAFAEGWDLGSYQFLPYKSEAERFQTDLQVEGNDVQAYIETGKIRAAATAFSRDLMNEVSDVLNPETYPEVLKKQFEGTGSRSYRSWKRRA